MDKIIVRGVSMYLLVLYLLSEFEKNRENGICVITSVSLIYNFEY